jgi:hypothetical protein
MNKEELTRSRGDREEGRYLFSDQYTKDTKKIGDSEDKKINKTEKITLLVKGNSE